MATHSCKGGQQGYGARSWSPEERESRQRSNLFGGQDYNNNLWQGTAATFLIIRRSERATSCARKLPHIATLAARRSAKATMPTSLVGSSIVKKV